MELNTQKAEFIRSAASLTDCPRDRLPQIAFAGRSNVGKSSVINRLLQRKNFARVGSAPGKTTHINYFLIDQKVYFVDRTRPLPLGLLLVDMRHKPTADDCVMCQWFKDSGKPFVVVANKQDKLKKSQLEPNLALIRETLQLPETVPVLPFSAEKGVGREELLGILLDYIRGEKEARA